LVLGGWEGGVVLEEKPAAFIVQNLRFWNAKQ